MNEDEFEWDAAKAKSNLAKHGVSFEAARCVFDDVFALERFDLDSEPARSGRHHGHGQRRYCDGGLYRAPRAHAHHLSEKSNEA